MTAALPRTMLVRQFDTYRLIPSRLIPSRFVAREDSVLAGIAADETHLADLFDLDNATNERLRGERGLLQGIGIDELVFGVPNFRMVNAAFTHARPEGSRFNGPDRGAWYCSFDIETALAEVSFHKTVEYQEIERFDDSVTYEALLADFSAGFHDLRGDTRFARCVAPQSYVASQRLAARLLAAGSVGVIYPSARRKSGTNLAGTNLAGTNFAGTNFAGTNLACFRPALVGNVRRGDTWRFTWSGTTTPRIEPGKAEGKRGGKPRRA